MSLWLGDLAQVFEGRIQVWEFCSTACVQWYLEGPFQSPVSFFYSALAEPVRPDLTRTLYAEALSKAQGVL